MSNFLSYPSFSDAKLDETRVDFQGLQNIIASLCTIGSDLLDKDPHDDAWAFELISWTHRQLASTGSLVLLTATSCILRIQQLVQFYLPKGIHQFHRSYLRKWTDYFNHMSSPNFGNHTFRRCG